MTDPQTPALEPGQIRLDVPYFRFNSMKELQVVKYLELEAMKRLETLSKGIAEGSPSLVGTDGKVLPQIAADITAKVGEKLREIADRPTLDEVFATKGALDHATYLVGLLVYRVFGRMLMSVVERELVLMVDSFMLLGMASLDQGVDPFETYKVHFEVKHQDVKTNQDLIVPPEVREAGVQKLRVVRDLFIRFMTMNGLIDQPSVADLPDNGTLQHGVFLPVLNESGKRVFKHMLAVMGVTESLSTQAPGIMEAFQKETGATQGEQIFLKDGDAPPKLG